MVHPYPPPHGPPGYMPPGHMPPGQMPPGAMQQGYAMGYGYGQMQQGGYSQPPMQYPAPGGYSPQPIVNQPVGEPGKIIIYEKLTKQMLRVMLSRTNCFHKWDEII